MEPSRQRDLESERRIKAGHIIRVFLRMGWRPPRLSDRAAQRILDEVNAANEAEARAMFGGAYKPPTLVLTAKELEVLLGYADGKGRTEIARGMGISPETVKDYCNKIRAKLGARTMTQAVAFAMKNGVIE